ncbi:DUF998 domain-containing protein [Chachezhania antarctica]|uniref:DUF998 domain-containing protein n=1 Tax=Chachezhania antarctica TaxID=2340860 RepID=UPI0013CEA8FF|nr:DUF998 domain-containing protein [Chachezhania antarctica]
MSSETTPPANENQPMLMICLGWFVVFGCVTLSASILIADFVVPDHDWIADTISDLGAGRYEFIVDIGLYAYSAAILCAALLAAHVHMGGKGWSIGILGLLVFGLLVFLIGARNEYGDADSDGWVIHGYLVYALGAAVAVVAFSMAKGLQRANYRYAYTLRGLGVLWVICTPAFYFLPTGIDGIYERWLGVIASAILITLAIFFIRRGHQLNA